MNYESLTNPNAHGVLHIPQFIAETELAAIATELNDPSAVQWEDNRSTFVNGRGLEIVQNHDVFALKLSRGDQSMRESIPNIESAVHKIGSFITELAQSLPSLSGWEADEMAIHRYDDQETGLSFHKDNNFFTGVVAIASLDGICDLAIKHKEIITPYTARPGDLMLLRAPGLVDTIEDVRPEHAVLNLQTPTRTSLMVRANNRPEDKIPGFTFANWN